MSVERHEAQMAADLGDEVLFQDLQTFDSVTVSKEYLPAGVCCMTDEDPCFLVYAEDGSVAAELPEKLIVRIAETEVPPPFSGNIATNFMKSAVLVSGATIMVPLFVGAGDFVEIDSASCEFIRRVD